MIIVSYPLKLNSREMDERIALAIGKEPERSRAGFGMRDLEFYNVTKRMVMKKLKEAGITVKSGLISGLVYISELE